MPNGADCCLFSKIVFFVEICFITYSLVYQLQADNAYICNLLQNIFENIYFPVSENFDMIAKTFKGLEVVLARELKSIGATDIEVLRRGVSFKGDLSTMYKANFCCRSAVRVLKPILTFTAQDADEVYEKIKIFEWEKYLSVSSTFCIDSVVYSEIFTNSRFLAYRVKDAIADRFMERDGKRPSVQLTNPDLKINVHVSHDEVTVSLDSSGEPLFKRGYRVEQTEAPINEVMAAGLLLLAGWDGQKDLIDPMCGSGTFLIEAALIARNIAPGVFRKNFAFEKWADFDSDLFQELYNDDSQERDFEHVIYGSDILKNAIDVANDNVRSASVADNIILSVSPIQDLELPSHNAMVIFNPPYGERLRRDDLNTLYDEIGSKLKQAFTGMDVWIVAEPNEALKNLGLAPSLKIQIDNGGIPCEFRKYQMFAGRRDDYLREKAEAGEKPALADNLHPEDEGFTYHTYEYSDPTDVPEEEENAEPKGASFNRGDRKPRTPRSEFYYSRQHDDENKDNKDKDSKEGTNDEYEFDTPEEREAYFERKRRHEHFVENQSGSSRPQSDDRSDRPYSRDRSGYDRPDRSDRTDRDSDRGRSNYGHSDRDSRDGNREGYRGRSNYGHSGYGHSDRDSDRGHSGYGHSDRDSRDGNRDGYRGHSSYGHSDRDSDRSSRGSYSRSGGGYSHSRPAGEDGGYRSRDSRGGYPADRERGGYSVQRRPQRSWSRDGYDSNNDSSRPEKPRHDFSKDGYKPTRHFDRRKGNDNKNSEK